MLQESIELLAWWVRRQVSFLFVGIDALLQCSAVLLIFASRQSVVLPVARPCWQSWGVPNSSVQKAYCRQSHTCGHFEVPISNVTLLLPAKSKIQIISKYINIILHTRRTFFYGLICKIVHLLTSSHSTFKLVTLDTTTRHDPRYHRT